MRVAAPGVAAALLFLLPGCSGDDQVAWRANGDQGSGTVTITELTDERIDGTFEFVAVADDEGTEPGVLTAAQGSFSVRYANPD